MGVRHLKTPESLGQDQLRGGAICRLQAAGRQRQEWVPGSS